MHDPDYSTWLCSAMPDWGFPRKMGMACLFGSLSLQAKGFIHILAAQLPAFEVVSLTWPLKSLRKGQKKSEVCKLEPWDDMNIRGKQLMDRDWFRSQGARFQEAYDLAEARFWSWKMLKVPKREDWATLGFCFASGNSTPSLFFGDFLSNVLTYCNRRISISHDLRSIWVCLNM